MSALLLFKFEYRSKDSNILSPLLYVLRSKLALKSYVTIFGFYFQYGPAVGLSFSVFRFMQPLLLRKMAHRRDCTDALTTEYKPSHVVVASMIAGSTAGFVSKTATYPLDLVKRRLQIGVSYVTYNFPIYSLVYYL